MTSGTFYLKFRQFQLHFRPFLIMLDARTLTYRAHAYFPDGVDAPVGFHGMWVSHPPMFWFVWTNCVNVTKSEPALPASRRTVYPTRINFNWSNFKQYQHSASKHWMWHLLFWVESSSLMQKAVCSFMFWHTVLGTHKSLTTSNKDDIIGVLTHTVCDILHYSK